MDLSEQQIDELTDLANGALLVHQRSEAQWYLYFDGESASQVEGNDAVLYLDQGWVERQGFESTLNLEMYALTDAGHAVIEPYLGPDEDEDGPTPYLLLSAALAEAEGQSVAYLVAVPVSPFDAEQLRRRTVLAETLAAADEAFVALEYETDLLVLDPEKHDELGALLPDAAAHALVTEMPPSWSSEAGLETRWASVLVSDTGFSFAVGLEDGRRLETDELAEAALMEVAVTLMGAEFGSTHGPEASA